MCSIVGCVASESSSVEETLFLLRHTRHRGPDAVGLYADGEVIQDVRLEGLAARVQGQKARISLGHCRLEIVGGPAARQPMASCDGRLRLIHNGEIYNYQELRALLKGHRLQTRSDSEVLVHLIETYYRGDLAEAVQAVLPLLDGMYAFAVTDGQAVVVARDPFGKKPVYFTPTWPVRFASEAKALVAHTSSVLRLPPGHLLVIQENEVQVRPGVTLERPPINLREESEALEAYADAFDQAIAKRTIGQRRVAVLLSGGVDSTLLAKALVDRGLEVTGYCVGQPEASDVQLVKRLARTLGLSVRVTELTPELVAAELPEIIRAIEMNGPVQVGAAIPMYLATKAAARDGHRVLYSGQAADELFAGYDWYREVLQREGPLALHARLWEDIDALYVDTLEREDRTSMAHSVELRAPFLDRDLLRVAMRMDPRLKLPDARAEGKWIHRRLAARRGVPEWIAFGAKVRAQDGASVGDVLEEVARQNLRSALPGKREMLCDYGSNYRYGVDPDSSPAIASLLYQVTRTHRIAIPRVQDAWPGSVSLTRDRKARVVALTGN